MENPKKELQDYLFRLIVNFIYVRSLLKQITLFLDWLKTNGEMGIKGCSHFFSLFFYTSKRTLCLDTYKLISFREKRSIYDWLVKAKESHSSLLPSEYVGWSDDLKSDRKVLSKKEYVELIDSQIEELNSHEIIAETLTALRDGGFAHAEKKYFSNPRQLEIDYPLNWIEIEALYTTIEKILRKHHSLILNSDMSMELVTGSDIDTVLKRSRGFDRFWKNKEINKMNLKKYVFLQDEYHEEDIYLKK
ncbi:MAG: hypothetical protein LAT81_14530 [Oceanicaulis sp.]|nr:hypothetical protein [Oceanicaulis sp.]